MSIVQAQSIDLLEGLAIVLSVVSLIITTVGFFAALKFYRDGVELQRAANDALTKLAEKTEFIQSQVGGMFDKTLDAAIGKREILSDQFEELNEQLEKTKAKLIEESIGQIGAAGEHERKRLAQLVDTQMAVIREKIETTRESAQEIVQLENLSPIMNQILAVLASYPNGVTAREAYKKIAASPRFPVFSSSTISRRLRELEDKGYVHSDGDKYFIPSRDRAV